MNEYIAWPVTLAAAYLIGSVPSGVIVARLWRGVDIRSYGSGSTGATNVLRTLGAKAGVLVLVLDVAKGTGATLIAIALTTDSPLNVALAATMSVVGHSFPIFAKFQGGKGIATGLGALFALHPLAGGAAFCGAVIAMVTRYVSLGSLVGTVTGFAILIWLMLIETLPYEYLAFSIPVFTLIFVRHAPNIKRLINGTESRLSFGRSKAASSGEPAESRIEGQTAAPSEAKDT